MHFKALSIFISFLVSFNVLAGVVKLTNKTLKTPIEVFDQYEQTSSGKIKAIVASKQTIIGFNDSFMVTVNEGDEIEIDSKDFFYFLGKGQGWVKIKGKKVETINAVLAYKVESLLGDPTVVKTIPLNISSNLPVLLGNVTCNNTHEMWTIPSQEIVIYCSAVDSTLKVKENSFTFSGTFNLSKRTDGSTLFNISGRVFNSVIEANGSSSGQLISLPSKQFSKANWVWIDASNGKVDSFNYSGNFVLAYQGKFHEKTGSVTLKENDFKINGKRAVALKAPSSDNSAEFSISVCRQLGYLFYGLGVTLERELTQKDEVFHDLISNKEVFLPKKSIIYKPLTMVCSVFAPFEL